MNRVFIFDVDGTLVRSGQPIAPDFAKFLMSFWALENCYIVSGSNRDLLEKQLPEKLLRGAKGVFACSGNVLYSGEGIDYELSYDFPTDLTEYCNQLIEQSPFCWRTGGHLDRRPGMLNVSVVGRRADRLERKRYVEFDKVAGERQYLIDSIMRAFPQYEASLGGQISIDIAPKGWNKSRVYFEIAKRHPQATLHFFGDRMDEGGNDFPLAKVLSEHGHYARRVDDFADTWNILSEEFFSEFALEASA